MFQVCPPCTSYLQNPSTPSVDAPPPLQPTYSNAVHHSSRFITTAAVTQQTCSQTDGCCRSITAAITTQQACSQTDKDGTATQQSHQHNSHAHQQRGAEVATLQLYQHSSDAHRQTGAEAAAGLTCHDAPQVIPHMTEIQIILCHSKVCPKGRYLFPQDEQLLHAEELCIHHALLLCYLPASSLH